MDTNEEWLMARRMTRLRHAVTSSSWWSDFHSLQRRQWFKWTCTCGWSTVRLSEERAAEEAGTHLLYPHQRGYGQMRAPSERR